MIKLPAPLYNVPQGRCFHNWGIYMDVKKHLTIDEQIKLLKTRGCIIENEELVKNILLDINYYRLTSYFLPFKESEDKYLEGTSFNKVYRNYLFDRKLRNMLSYIIEHIEVTI